MKVMEEGALVIINCLETKEKIWGVLLRLDHLGPVVRGLSLTTFEDWLRQEREQEQRFIAATTTFVPMNRVERIYLDESSDLTPSFGDRYRAACGGDAVAALTGGTESEESGADGRLPLPAQVETKEESS